MAGILDEPLEPDPMVYGVGGAITGKAASPPMQNIMAPAPQPQGGGGFLSDPRDRAALLQIGLNLMQPPAWGSGTGGHIAQSIGHGGEAVSRGEKEDIARQSADSKLAIADERLKIAQQNADTRERRALGGAIKGSLTANQQLMKDWREQQASEKKAEKEAKSLDEQAEYYATTANDALTKRDDPLRLKYGGKDKYTIKKMLEAERAGGGAAAGPAIGTQRKQNGVVYTWDGKNWN